jgi:hypothetical protein
VKHVRSLVKDRDAFSVLADAEAAPPLLKEALRADHFPTVGDTGELPATEQQQVASPLCWVSAYCFGICFRPHPAIL